MARKQFKPSKLTVFISLVLLGFILLLLPANLTSRINFTFIDIFDFFLNIGSSAARYPDIEKNSPYYVSRHEYNRLWVAYSNLHAELFNERKKVEKLENIRITEPNPNTSVVLASVISTRGGELIINRGAEHGIKSGFYVLGDNAVIGIVGEVSPTISSVKIITSHDCKLHVKISAPQSDSYFNGTIQGDGKEAAKIPNVPQKYKIKQGCNVYAAPKAGLLESPRIIGAVSACVVDETNPVVWDITVTPAYDIDKITDVAVIVINTEAKK